MALERQYTIPLRKEWLKVPKYQRAEKAMRAIKQFLAKHMKSDPEDIKVGRWVNEAVWERGIKSPPHKLRVNVSKDDKGMVKVDLIELSERAKKIQAREDARAKAFEQKKKDDDKKMKAEEEAIKKAAEEQKKKEEAQKTDAEKEAEKEEKAIEEKVKHEVSAAPAMPKAAAKAPEKHAKKTHPVRQALRK